MHLMEKNVRDFKKVLTKYYKRSIFVAETKNQRLKMYVLLQNGWKSQDKQFPRIFKLII